MTDYAVPNRVSLGRPHPVKCGVPDCITILSVYNGSIDGFCFRHDPKIGAKAMRALAERLAKHGR